jgi:hypothetical protein
MIQRIYLSHVAGRCAVCGAPILDPGYDGDSGKWEHDWAQAGSAAGEDR